MWMLSKACAGCDRGGIAAMVTSGARDLATVMADRSAAVVASRSTSATGRDASLPPATIFIDLKRVLSWTYFPKFCSISRMRAPGMQHTETSLIFDSSKFLIILLHIMRDRSGEGVTSVGMDWGVKSALRARISRTSRSFWSRRALFSSLRVIISDFRDVCRISHDLIISERSETFFDNSSKFLSTRLMSLAKSKASFRD